MCIYVFIHGIVKIEIYSYNKRVNTLYTVITFPSYILPKQAKTSEPEDECCVSQCTYTSDNIHDSIPLDKLKNYTALPYITLIAVISLQVHLVWTRGTDQRLRYNFKVKDLAWTSKDD